MFEFIQNVLKTFKDLPIKKIIVIFILAYPIFGVIWFKDELSLYFKSDTVVNVDVADINSVIKKTNGIKDNFNAVFVSVWVYQPKGDIKKYKERITYSADSSNILSELKLVDLIHHPNLITPLSNSKSVTIKNDNGYSLSRYLNINNLEVIYIIPINNDYGLLIGEVAIGFRKELNEMDLIKLKSSTYILSLLI